MIEWLKAENESQVADFYNEHYAHGFDSFRRDDWSYFIRLINKFHTIDASTGIIDYGCGHGGFLQAVYDSEKYPPILHGIDVSEKAIRLAERRKFAENAKIWPSPNDNYLGLKSMEDFTSDIQYDIATCWGSIEHCFNPLKALINMLMSVRCGGHVFITVPLEFEDCLSAIKSEANQANNERFATREEWIDYFSQVKKPISDREIGGPDLVLVYRK